MNLRAIPRFAVDRYLKAARWPVDTTVALLGRNGATTSAIDRIDATFRAAAATALGDRELREDARRRRAREGAAQVLTSRGGPLRAARPRSGLVGEVLRVLLDVVRPLVGHLVLREAGVHGAGLDAGVAVDAFLGVDVQLLDVVVVRLVGRRMDAVDRAHLDARVVLRANAGLGDDVGHFGSGSLITDSEGSVL